VTIAALLADPPADVLDALNTSAADQ